MQKIKAIFFDLGNVLVRFDIKKSEEALNAYGNIPKGSFIDYVLDSRNCNKYMEGSLSSSQFYAKTCRLFRLKIKYGEFYTIWNDIFFSYPEMEKIVRNIKEKYPEIKLILLSNTNEKHYEFIKKEYTFLSLLDEHIVSHEVGKIKPHPAIFKTALNLSKTLPKETLYIDDRADLIEAARTMGIRAFFFTGHKELNRQLGKLGIHLGT